MEVQIKSRLLIAAIVFANCAPWLVYRMYGSPYDWLSYLPNNDLFEPGTVSLRFTEFYGIPGYFEGFQVLGLAQLFLFAIWFAFGLKPVTWRLTYLLSLVALLTRMHIDDPTVTAWFAAKQCILRFSIGFAFVAGFILLLARMAGIQIRQDGVGADSPQASDGANPHQFTVGHILWWTTGLAFFLGLWNRIITVEETWVWIRMLPMEIGQYLGTAVMTIGCLWLALGTRHHLIRLLVFFVAIVIASCWQYEFSGFRLQFDVSQIAQRLMVFGPASLWIIATLCAFRAAGYRIQWRGRATL